MKVHFKNNVTHSIVLMIIFVVSYAIPYVSMAAENDKPLLILGGALGYSTFGFEQKLDSDITFVTAESSMTGIYKRFIGSLNISGALKGANVSEEDEIGNAKRFDADLLMGFQVNKSLTVFGGAKSGLTTIDFENRQDGSLAEDRYKQLGPYVGSSYTFHMLRSSKLTLSLAYAYLRATNSFHEGKEASENNPGSPLEFDDITGKANGYTKGFSYGTTWSMPITHELIYLTKLKINYYTQQIKYNQQTFNVNEKYVVLTVGVFYIF